MRQCKNTLFIVPYIESKTLECPICHNQSNASKQNVVIYSGVRRPSLKFAAKVRKCNACKLYYINRVSLFMLKEKMKQINRMIIQRKSDQEDYNPIIVIIKDQTLQTLQNLMRKQNPSSDEFEAFLKSYLSESENASLSTEEIPNKGTPNYTKEEKKIAKGGLKTKFVYTETVTNWQ